MKTLKVWALALLFTTSFGLASAQVQTNPRIPLPDNIRNLITNHHFEEAVSSFDHFKAQKIKEKVDPYHLLYLEMTFYRDIVMFLSPDFSKKEEMDKANNKREELYQQILAKYPNRPDTYLMQIGLNSTPQEIVDLANKALEATPSYKEAQIDAYRMRSEGYLRMGNIEASSADANKVAELERQ